jgi:ABC-2 type transport system ATP-binding protein
MSEMALTAEHVIVIGRGRLIADTSVASIVAQASAGSAVRVSTPQVADLCEALARPGVRIDPDPVGDGLEVHGLSSREIGEIAARRSIVLHELTPRTASLEEAYMALTGESVEYHAGTLTPTIIPD